MGEPLHYDTDALLFEIRDLAELADIPSSRVNPKMDGSDRKLNAGPDLVRLARRLVRAIKHLQERPKLWVVRVKEYTEELGRVDIGECGDAVPCIAAFDRETDAAYVAACLGGNHEEWGSK